MKKLKSLFVLLFFLSISCIKQVSPPSPLLPVPSEQQLAWHDFEQYTFVHFTTNTFTGKEWGYGDENPDIFNPGMLDTDQWAKVIKDAGLKGIVLTCKHHDGFCLWPSAYTEHSVKNSKFHNNMFCLFLERTAEFVQKTKIPVMGYKVLAAGALTPEDGFNWAFENGADFICAGMFDFQIVNDVNIYINTLENLKSRKRGWYS